MGPDAELLIARLCNSLDPHDRPAFLHDVQTALRTPRDWGDGLVYRTVVPLWRHYFHPPPDTARTRWDISQGLDRIVRSKIVSAPPIARCRSDEL